MAEHEPWYSEGLRFTCTQCGNCCTGAPGVVWVDDDEMQQIAEHTGKSIGEIRLMHTRLVGNRVTLKEYANGDCTFFDGATRRCTIYSARPKQCRTWPFWPSNIASVDDWSEVQRDCPGAGVGELYSLDQIETRANEIEI